MCSERESDTAGLAFDLIARYADHFGQWLAVEQQEQSGEWGSAV